MVLRALFFFGLVFSIASASRAQEVDYGQVPDLFDAKGAVAYSQAAVGRKLDDLSFTDHMTRPVRLSDFDGKPVIVSLVYTACSQSCPILIEYLADAVEVARDAFGAGRFMVLTVGFDSSADTPQRMRAYAATHGISDSDWLFLSGEQETVDRLMDQLGFLRSPSPQGYEHIAQTSIVDSRRRVHSHVYGATFEPPALVAPLKAVLLGELSYLSNLTDVIERVRLFCTLYDSGTGRYGFDYSFFISLAVGGSMLLGLAVLLVKSFLGGRPPRGVA